MNTCIAQTPYAIAIVGPTASGKTSLALDIAKAHGGEIISCDSMQIYRGMDIGTAKATKEERRAVPHHLLDLLQPNEPYSAADYAIDAERAVNDVLLRGRLPIFCGGTGLYLKAACTGRHESAPPPNEDVRKELLSILEKEDGADLLYDELCRVDPLAALSIPRQNVRRVVRALEIFRATGKPKSAWDEESRALPPKINCLTILLDCADRAALYRRIELRVDDMMASGLTGEVRALFDAGYLSPNTTAAQAIGYKELLAYVTGACTEGEAAETIKLATRHYAKRQLTWFRALPDVYRVTMDKADGTWRTSADVCAEIAPVITRFLQSVANP